MEAGRSEAGSEIWPALALMSQYINTHNVYYVKPDAMSEMFMSLCPFPVTYALDSANPRNPAKSTSPPSTSQPFSHLLFHKHAKTDLILIGCSTQLRNHSLLTKTVISTNLVTFTKTVINTNLVSTFWNFYVIRLSRGVQERYTKNIYVQRDRLSEIDRSMTTGISFTDKLIVRALRSHQAARMCVAVQRS